MLLGLLATLPLPAQPYTRGVGIYPGDPREDFSPVLRPNDNSYRNLALRRPAYHSSSYDYNLTAQLITDGIKETRLPRWVATATSQGTLPRNEREWLVDNNPFTLADVNAARGWAQIELEGGDNPPEVDRIEMDARVQSNDNLPAGWICLVSGSDDGQSWKELGRQTNPGRPTAQFHVSFALSAPVRHHFYRVAFEAAGATLWRIAEVTLFDKGRRLPVGGPYDFASAWMSASRGEEWVYVDLGAASRFDRILLYWIWRAAEGAVQASDDAKNWKTLQPLTMEPGNIEEIRLAAPVAARYVRVLMTRPAAPTGYMLSELEVYGRGGMEAHPRAGPPPHADGRLDLAGGNWRVERSSRVAADGAMLSKTGFPDEGWLVATVPGTVLTSYYNAGALPDPNFGDNQLMISDSYFYSDFWYRNEFVAPRIAAGRHVWLNFDGINWKAEVFLNGESLGRIEGGFLRGRFDVTARLHPGQKNALAVRIEKNATPGSVKEKTFESPDKNGGPLGADNPTFHASIGWDWIPTIRGRNTGIWGDVYLTSTGPVTIQNPFVTTTLPLPDTSRANVSIAVTLENQEARAVSGILRARFGDLPLEQPVTVPPTATVTVTLTGQLENPKLWWPAGYGEPSLYSVDLRFETGDKRLSDTTAFQAGVRHFNYSEDGGALKIWINGRRFVGRGGNWGFSESMLRYRAREYDAAVRYHRDMHFTMIRNWVGQTGDEAFYRACDRYGIVVWQDFWLANPTDGPNPDGNDLFLRNAKDFVQRIRNHPSVGLYCGRNEGNPPKALDDDMRQIVAEQHPGLYYIPHSSAGGVSGGGPYRAMPPQFYFTQRATPKLHSELGMPNIVSLDSLRAMMPESDMWPQDRMWGLHDFTLRGAQGGASFRERIDQSYGGAGNVADWVSLAQFINYEGYRAIFEAQSRNRMGVLLWMSHPAWPSFVWQTYDYFFEPAAAYFGSKKGSEPLHIQWNPVTDSIEVVNYSAGNAPGLTARVEIRNLDGVVKWEKTASLDSLEDSTLSPIRMEYPPGLTPVHFLRLTLTRGNSVVSENFYWRGLEEDNYRALRDLPKAKLEVSTTVQRQGDRWRMTTELRNVSTAPALMVKLKAVREKTGDRILPALYSDNYVALMPGERRAIVTELQHADTRGEKPAIVVEGFNVF